MQYSNLLCTNVVYTIMLGYFSLRNEEYNQGRHQPKTKGTLNGIKFLYYVHNDISIFCPKNLLKKNQLQ